MLIRRIHKNALAWVNLERAKKNLEPIEDFPIGYRTLDADDNANINFTPIGRALGREIADEAQFGEAEDAVEDAVETVMFGILSPCKEAAFVWYILFLLGFYSRYDEAKLYVKLPPTWRRKLFNAAIATPAELKEHYLRGFTLYRYTKGRLAER